MNPPNVIEFYLKEWWKEYRYDRKLQEYLPDMSDKMLPQRDFFFTVKLFKTF